jgi:hypothetical protein
MCIREKEHETAFCYRHLDQRKGRIEEGKMKIGKGGGEEREGGRQGGKNLEGEVD